MEITSIIICPECHGKLTFSRENCNCLSCNRSYPIIHDIVDFRSKPIEQEPNILEAIERFEETSFAELIEILLRNVSIPERIEKKVRDYYYEQEIRANRMTNMFLNSVEIRHWGFALDFGCGSGSSINSLREKFKFVLGVDSSLGQLLLARKALKQDDRIYLFCAYGEKLPFRNNIFDYVQALNVLEHIPELSSVMQEVKRCLVQNGRFSGDSRNRFDIFTPDPHSGLRFAGYLPKKWIPKYVRWRCNASYENTYLRSLIELRSELRSVFKESELSITIPDISAYGYTGVYLKFINFLRKYKVIFGMLLYFFPSHLVIIKKNIHQ